MILISDQATQNTDNMEELRIAQFVKIQGSLDVSNSNFNGFNDIMPCYVNDGKGAQMICLDVCQ